MSKELKHLPLGNISLAQDSSANDVQFAITVPNELPVKSGDFWIGVLAIGIGIYWVNKAIDDNKSK